MTKDEKRVLLAIQFGGVRSDEIGHDEAGLPLWTDTLAGEDVTDIVDGLIKAQLVSFDIGSTSNKLVLSSHPNAIHLNVKEGSEP